MMVDKPTLEEVVIYLGDALNVNNSFELKEHVQGLLNDGCHRITLDFSQTSMIDASGLGKILMLQKKIREKQGELRITNITNKYIQRTFDLIQIHKVINVDSHYSGEISAD